MSYTPKFTRPGKSRSGVEMKKSHSFGAIADLTGLSFTAKSSRSKKITKGVKDSYRLPDAGQPASRTVSDDAVSVDSLDFDPPTFQLSRVGYQS